MEVVTRGGKILNVSKPKVSFYEKNPEGTMTIDQFEKWSFDRMIVLRKIESLKALGKRGEEMDFALRECVNQYLPLNSFDSTEARKDQLSHFVLRLAMFKE